MSNKQKPDYKIIEFFKNLGFEYKVVTDSIYTDKRDSPVHYFQSNDADGFKICSTILADDAIRLYNRIGPLGSFGFHCAAGIHLIDGKDCKKCKHPVDGRSIRKNYAKAQS